MASGYAHKRAARLVLADAHFYASHAGHGYEGPRDGEALDVHYARLVKAASAALAAGDELGAFHAFQEVFDAGAVVRESGRPPLARSELVPVFTRLLELAQRDHERVHHAGHPSWPELRELAYALTGQRLGPEPPEPQAEASGEGAKGGGASAMGGGASAKGGGASAKGEGANGEGARASGEGAAGDPGAR